MTYQNIHSFVPERANEHHQPIQLLVAPSGEVVQVVGDADSSSNEHDVNNHRPQHEDIENFPPEQCKESADPILARHISLELLNPVYGSESRKSTLMIACVNLVATVCGGGVLSLPLVFRRAGVIPTTLLMLYGVLSTDFSLYVLVSCARRTGGRSYGDVAKAAFGSAAEVVTTSLLGCMLVGSLTAYLVLVKDIWTPVLLTLLPKSLQEPLIQKRTTDLGITDNSIEASARGANTILLLILIAGTPLLLKKDLHALRHTCYIGFCSCTLLMLAVVFRAWQAVQTPTEIREINWYSTDIADLAFAFPIVVLCFFCSYNVLGVHSSLLNPTRERVKCVLDTSMLLCIILFYSVGLGGYLYALDETCDNIVLNFSLNDPAILLGRIGFCFTLLFGLPLITLPCREAFLAVPGQIRAWRVDDAMAREFLQVDQKRKEGAHLVINGVDFDETEPLLVTSDPEKQHTTMLTYGASNSVEHVLGTEEDEGTAATSTAETQTSLHLEDHEQCCDSEKTDRLVHFMSTFALVSLCYTFAISVPGVGFVWSLAGSSMAILIAFIIPTACYIKIREHKRINPRSVTAWTLLLLSIVAAPVCTRQAIMNAW